MSGELRCAVGVPNVGAFGDPVLLVELAAAEHGWDDVRERVARLDESLGLLDALWGGEPVTVRGEYLTAEDVRMVPRPLQRPRIPVWCGGRWPSKAPFRRAARWGRPTARRPGAAPIT